MKFIKFLSCNQNLFYVSKVHKELKSELVIKGLIFLNKEKKILF